MRQWPGWAIFREGCPRRARPAVIDVTGPVVIERSTIERTARRPDSVLEMAAADIVATDTQDGRPATPIGAPMALAGQVYSRQCRSRCVPRLRSQAIYRPVIVIDPGHGGDDTGATRHGTVEKMSCLRSV